MFCLHKNKYNRWKPNSKINQKLKLFADGVVIVISVTSVHYITLTVYKLNASCTVADVFKF